MKKDTITMSTRPTICAYYFPNWHVDARNEVIHGRNWTEWRVTEYATPRFPGHDQPKVPLWGYGDEASPAVMAEKIKAANDYGVDAFIFDWYWFYDGSYRERCIRDGFLGAPNTNDLKFAIMWANHDPIYAHPGNYRKPAEPLWTGDVNGETFRQCTDHLIADYFTRPNYLRVDGKLYFSLYRAKQMTEQMGGWPAMKEAIGELRRKVEKAGLGELMIDCMASSISGDSFDYANLFTREIGIDCCSNYGWGGRSRADFPALSYADWIERCKGEHERYAKNLHVPYNPVVCTGWDSSPRTVQSDMYDHDRYPFGVVMTGNTPELFQKALEYARDSHRTGKLLHISCWNEWTEGAYLEPDTRNGYGFLEAVKAVFGVKKEEEELCAVR